MAARGRYWHRLLNVLLGAVPLIIATGPGSELHGRKRRHHDRPVVAVPKLLFEHDSVFGLDRASGHITTLASFSLGIFGSETFGNFGFHAASMGKRTPGSRTVPITRARA